MSERPTAGRGRLQIGVRRLGGGNDQWLMTFDQGNGGGLGWSPGFSWGSGEVWRRTA